MELSRNSTVIANQSTNRATASTRQTPVNRELKKVATKANKTLDAADVSDTQNTSTISQSKFANIEVVMTT